MLGLGVVAVPAAAQEEVPVSSLLSDPALYDQHVVTIVGEIVGDFGERDAVVWVQVNDDPYVAMPLARSGRLAGTNTGIAVRLPGIDPGEFGQPGRHGVRGPVLRVTGVFRNLDPALGGLTFVDAADVVLLAPSEKLPVPGVDTAALVPGIILTLTALLALAHRRDLLPHRPGS